MEVGDIVLVKKQEGDLSGHYRFGIVEEAPVSEDGKFRKVIVKYRNVGENTDRTTRRGVGGLVLIRRCDEIDVWTELFEASRISNILWTIKI